jgi:glycerol kinase
MAEDTGTSASTLYVDGGVAQSDVLLQLQADCAGVGVARPANVETTALGAAIAAGLGAGVFSSLEAIPAVSGGTTRFAPAISPDARAAKLASWKAAVEATYGWADRA